MNYKIEKVLNDNKKYIIVFAIVWMVLEIILVSPIAVAISSSLVNGKISSGVFFNYFINELTSFSSVTRIFNSTTFGIFGKTTFWMTIIFLVCTMIGLIRAKPKHRYTDIEHGSSDWSEGGEQYRILNKKSGILLAENNYLPLDKLGNINVLVVGRFWFW